MRLTQPIETSGFFWLPGDAENRVPGVLRISQSGRATLEVTGDEGQPLVGPLGTGTRELNSEGADGADTIRILGIVERRDSVTRGGSVTLDGCFRQRETVDLLGGLSRATFYVPLSYVGAEYGANERITFSKFSLSIEALDLWLATYGIEVKHDRAAGTGSIHYRVLDDIPVGLPHGDRLEFSFALTAPGLSSLPMSEALVRQTSKVYVSLQTPRTLQDFVPLAVKLCHFFSLALDENLSIQAISGHQTPSGGDDPERPIPIEIYGQFAPWSENAPNIHWHDVLFRYPDVSDRLDPIMACWLDNYEMYEPAIKLYFASRSDTTQYLDTKVLWLAQGLETLHRRSCPDTVMLDEEFSSRKELILESCPQKWREWLSDALRHSNELSLRVRIWRLIQPFNRWFGNSHTRRGFVKKVVDTRNYLTHYDQSLEAEAVKGQELSDLHQKLEALFRLHLLKLVGLDEATIDSIVQKNLRFRHSLHL